MTYINQQKPIVVLTGGSSLEADVGRVTAQAVMDALVKLGFPHVRYDLPAHENWKKDLQTYIVTQPVGFMFLALHGSPGEDGVIQALLEEAHIPYQGSGAVPSLCAMDKVVSKQVFQLYGLDNIDYMYTSDAQDVHAQAFLDKCGKVVVKPVCGGSSQGVRVLEIGGDVAASIQFAQENGADDRVLIEQFVSGMELSVGVLDGQAQGCVEIVPQGSGFYDYAAKYSDGGSKHIIPAQIGQKLAGECARRAEMAVKILGCTGACRVDFRYDEAYDLLSMLEVNTLPGMTPTSLLPELMQARGMDFPALINWMIEDGLAKHKHTL